ncbi:hypothetical protein GCM10020258_38250 [Sphingomonas yabuuchiae]
MRRHGRCGEGFIEKAQIINALGRIVDIAQQLDRRPVGNDVILQHQILVGVFIRDQLPPQCGVAGIASQFAGLERAPMFADRGGFVIPQALRLAVRVEEGPVQPGLLRIAGEILPPFGRGRQADDMDRGPCHGVLLSV